MIDLRLVALETAIRLLFDTARRLFAHEIQLDMNALHFISCDFETNWQRVADKSAIGRRLVGDRSPIEYRGIAFGYWLLINLRLVG